MGALMMGSAATAGLLGTAGNVSASQSLSTGGSLMQTGLRIAGRVAENNAAQAQSRAQEAGLHLDFSQQNLQRTEELRRVLAEQRVAAAVTGRSGSAAAGATRTRARRDRRAARARYNLSTAILQDNRGLSDLNTTLGIAGDIGSGVSSLVGIQRGG